MYLLIGYESDSCCQIVSDLLRERGYPVYIAAEPLAGDTIFSWAFDTTSSKSSLSWEDGQLVPDNAWRGVLVRGRSEPTKPDGWQPADLEYMRAEIQGAFIAWLQPLQCPVINRLTADLWFRPQRPLVEWRKFFLSCSLPTLSVQVTNNQAAARCFADRWHGELLYSPLTSLTRYPVVTAEQWVELDRLMEHFTVALLEPYQGIVCYATIAGQRVIWSNDPDLSAAQRNLIDAGLCQLARVLQIDMLQVEMLLGADGPRCIGINLFPQFAVHSVEEQLTLGKEIVALLAGNH